MISTPDLETRLAQSSPSPLAQLAGLYTFLMYGKIGRKLQDRWGN